VKNDKHAVQRAEYLKITSRGYTHRSGGSPELEEKKAELTANGSLPWAKLQVAFKEHATARQNQSILYCGGALLNAMR
jgi:hypothetical protein